MFCIYCSSAIFTICTMYSVASSVYILYNHHLQVDPYNKLPDEIYKYIQYYYFMVIKK